MKLLKSDGRLLEVFDLGPCIHRLKAAFGPIKLHGLFILDDAVAKDWVKQLGAAQNNDAVWRANSP